MWAIADLPALSDLFPVGFLHQVMMHSLESSYDTFQRWPAPVRDEYFKWRDNFGQVAPDAKVMTHEYTGDFKGQLATDACFSSPTLLRVKRNRNNNHYLCVRFDHDIGFVLSIVSIRFNVQRPCWRRVCY
jgi:hypothetical protein